jgi:uncharacterized membrane protein YczE
VPAKKGESVRELLFGLSVSSSVLSGRDPMTDARTAVAPKDSGPRVTTWHSFRVKFSPLGRRLLSLYAGLVLFGVSIALMVRARLGLAAWDVLNQGIARHTGLPFGWVVIGIGAAVLMLWIPLRQRPGFGTISNVVVVGVSVAAALAVLPQPRPLMVRAALLIAGILVNGVATGMYIGAGMGAGPRDGLMTGLAQRGISIRLARTLIELTVLGSGWLLGGDVGAGTVLYAVSIGPLAHYFIPKFTLPRADMLSRAGPSGGECGQSMRRA